MNPAACRFFSIVVFFAVGASLAAAWESDGFVVKSPNLEVRLSAAGKIEAVELADETAPRPVKAETALARCRQEGAASATKIDNGGVQFEKHFTQEKGSGRATVIEKFLPTKDSVRWELEVRGEGEPWSTPIETQMTFPQDEPSLFWTAWGDPRPDGKDWTDPLRPAEWLDREFNYGGRRFQYFKEPGTFSLPLATVLDKKQGRGLSLVLSPDDLVLSMKMRTTKQGLLTVSRENHRLGKGDVLRLAMDLVAHPADWRGGLGWMVTRYPQYFDPPNPLANQMAGCGAYSSHSDINEVERLMQMAFRVNWKASFDFPYMGMFIPPVASDTEEWTDFMNQKISIAKMRDSARALRQTGFYLLNYFNVTEFGARTTIPAPPRKAANDGDLWKDSNDFLYYALGEAILPFDNGKPFVSWEGCLVMDPGEKVYQDYLIEQARRHIEKFPESSGLCIDRLDWLMEYNRQRDDGVTWLDGKPARCLAVAWRELMNRLGRVMHEAGKVIFVNSMYPRLDIMRQVDGIYDEHGQHPHSLNACTLLALNKPYIAWTWELDELDKRPDEFFQRHLHLGAYLSAPVPGNDHTILPNAKYDQYFLDYGPLLDAMRGKRWLLVPNVVQVVGDKALANVFEVPGGYAVPVTFGGKEASVQVVLQGLPLLPGQKGFRIEALQPGEDRPAALHVNEEGNLLRVDVPLKSGCAMLLLAHTWMEPKAAYFHGKARVELGSTLDGAKFHYTLDGSEPTAQSPVYSSPVSVEKTIVVKAAAFEDGKKIGATLEREYVKIPPAAPTISAEDRFFDEATEVAIRAIRPTEGETIHFTLDGTAPTKDSPLYTKPVRIDRTVQVQAVRVTDGGTSPAASATFTCRGPKPPVPNVFLSDLKPLAATVGWGDHPRMDRSIIDKPLTLSGKVYEKGVGVHADSELEYELKPEYARFVAVIGLDDEMIEFGQGNIIFEVEIDGSKVLSSPVVRAGQYTYVDLPIPAGGKKIRLSVFGGGINIGINGDHGDWANAGFLVKPSDKADYPFFPFCIDWHDAKHRNFEEQAVMLKELGYDGVGHIWLDKVDERIKSLDAKGLKLYQITMEVNVAPDKPPYDLQKFKDVLALIKGRKVQFCLLVGGGKPSDAALDPQAVKVLREMSDLAADSGAQLLLYPHVGNWVERIEDSVRVAEKVDRPNVGVMFNLCHWLKVDKSRDYRPLLEKAMPRLWAVSINGADERDDKDGWDHYIQPLDKGSFDMAKFLRTLKELGYKGPIGLQCYGIGGDTREHLARSMEAWKKLNK